MANINKISGQKLVDLISVGYHFKNDLAYHGTERAVYQVSKSGQDFVFKVAHPHQWQYKNHLKAEEEALNRACGLEGVTRLYEVFTGRGGYFGILKEFMGGRDLRVRGGKISPELYNGVVETVGELHLRGVANLEIFPRNLIVSDDPSRIKIIDLGTAVLEDGATDFEFAKNKDKANLLAIARQYVA